MLYENDPENNAVVRLFWGIIFFEYLWIVEQNETFLSFMPDSFTRKEAIFRERQLSVCKLGLH